MLMLFPIDRQKAPECLNQQRRDPSVLINKDAGFESVYVHQVSDPFLGLLLVL